jgi:regulator of protease activity HflC (stomatin/prohibitin superfamily)
MEVATIGIIAALLIVLLSQVFKILQEYERGVIFFLGRFQKVKGPGDYWRNRWDQKWGKDTGR